MKEVAVLKWHKVGCYATAFATVAATYDSALDDDVDQRSEATSKMTKRASAVTAVQQRRDEIAQTTHWLAAGAKDGKVSLWSIY